MPEIPQTAKKLTKQATEKLFHALNRADEIAFESVVHGAERLVYLSIHGLADGEAISLTFRMDADLRAILVKQLADLRDALRRTQEARQ